MNSDKWLTVPGVEQENYLSKIAYYTADENFDNFRSESQWKIWESGQENIGRISLDSIQRNNLMNLFLKHEKSFKLNDLVGSPTLFNFPEVDAISSSTIQYACDALNINNLISSRITPVERIVEIGAGFGGLCRAISVLIDFKEYIIIDLPEVLALQEKYLSKFPVIFKKISFVNALDRLAIEGINPPDLTIACASIAELDSKTQDHYNKRIICNSDYVYIAYNTMFRKTSKKIFRKLFRSWTALFVIKTWEGLQGTYFSMKIQPNKLKRTKHNVYFKTTYILFYSKESTRVRINKLRTQIKNLTQYIRKKK